MKCDKYGHVISGVASCPVRPMTYPGLKEMGEYDLRHARLFGESLAEITQALDEIVPGAMPQFYPEDESMGPSKVTSDVSVIAKKLANGWYLVRPSLMGTKIDVVEWFIALPYEKLMRQLERNTPCMYPGPNGEIVRLAKA